jgi:hypothetical protein
MPLVRLHRQREQAKGTYPSRILSRMNEELKSDLWEENTQLKRPLKPPCS